MNMPLSPDRKELLGKLEAEMARRMASGIFALSDSDSTALKKGDYSSISDDGILFLAKGVKFDSNQPLELIPASAQKAKGVEFDPSKPFELVPARSQPSAPVAQDDIYAGFTPSKPSLGSAEQLQSAVNEAGMSKSQYAVLFGAPLVVAIAAFLIYRRKSKRDTTKPKNAPGPADFSMASLGVKRISFVLFALVASGALVVATLIFSDEPSKPKFPIFVLLFGIVASALTWFAVRVIDWVIRGFKFGS